MSEGPILGTLQVWKKTDRMPDARELAGQHFKIVIDCSAFQKTMQKLIYPVKTVVQAAESVRKKLKQQQKIQQSQQNYSSLMRFSAFTSENYSTTTVDGREHSASTNNRCSSNKRTS
ncbi:hypothetical protein TNCV_1715231 [Trichonephila clavipes]|nr:hypothetical protein TNCV_1715231 [Trichonephila clavipes]